MREFARWIYCGLFASALSGCGLSDVGNKSSTPPTAVATVIGQKPTSAAGVDPVAVTVRSGADVLLSGKDSDGVDAALTDVTWEQTDSGAGIPKITLISRSKSTVSFTAPTIAADTTLNFRLTVTDAKGSTATKNVRVLVKAVNDANQFLSPLATPHKFVVAVATKEGLSGLSADAPVCVAVDRSIQYVGRDGAQHTVSVGASTKADLAWNATVGGAAESSNAPTDFASYTNPRTAFDIPALNADDLYVLFNQAQPNQKLVSAQQVAQQLVPSDIDAAQLLFRVTATPGSCDGTVTSSELGGKTLKVAVLDASDAIVASTSATSAGSAVVLGPLGPDDVVGPPAAGVETKASAIAYYQAIDPNGTKLTLDDWLNANCFDASAKNYAADAHSVYTNNFDLGFGRDMYFTTCKADHVGAGGATTAKKDDMASVVINYPSLEGAANKIDAVIAVAMEYSAAADGSNPGKRFPKFYVFAPDDRDGKFKRVLSANFDRRGEKYVPGACAACHGGRAPAFVANQPYPAAGDINATFMPWDLDSFLYSDTDPSFVGRSIDKSLFTRAAQEPALKKLNQLAYATYQTPQIVPNTGIDRFDAPRKLVEQWYGGAGLPNSTYGDSSTPSGWAGQDNLYHKVFARNCRACHTQNAVPEQQFTDYQKFIDTFVNGTTNPNLHIQQLAYHDGRMPLARLTMDRFWVDYANGDSAAKLLATHLQQVTGQTDLLTSAQDAAPPGKPVTNVTINGVSATAAVPATRFGEVRVDASTSIYVAKYTWNLCLTPSAGGACATRTLVGTGSAPAFLANESGSYTLRLDADNGLGATTTSTYTVTVPNKVPSVAGCLTDQSVAIGVPLVIPLDSCTVPGDSTSTLQIQDPVTLTWGASVNTLAYSATVAGLGIDFSYTTQATAPAHLNYRVCDIDGDCGAGAIDVAIVATLSATGDTVTTTLPALPLTITAASLLANDVILPTNDLVTLAVTSQPANGTALPASTGRAGAIVYSSTHVSCDITGKDIVSGGTCVGDVFPYRLTSSDGNTVSNSANVAVKVQATTSFSQGSGQIYGFLGGTGCASCHDGTDASATPQWRYSNSAANTWSEISQWATKTFGGAATTDPTATAIYTNPCMGTDAHSTSAQHLSPTQCATLLQWIKEGANFR